MRNYNIIFFLLFLLSGRNFAQPCEVLVWSDEFNYTGLPDPAYWTYDVGDGCDIGLCGWGNNEAQYYTYQNLNNVRVEDGMLTIEAHKENMGTRNYTSARIKTLGMMEITYGRVEISARVPGGNGPWSALWMLGLHEHYGGWPDLGEIDIMEYMGRNPGRVTGAAHCRAFYGNTASWSAINDSDVETVFHTYSIEWTPQTIRWYLDGVHFHTYNNQGTGYAQWPFDKPFYFIFNIAMGGNLGGNINDNIFNNPVTMDVDYIRVYQTPEISVLTGKDAIYKGESGLLYYTRIPASSYTWSVPADAVILQGQGTDSIWVDWGCTAGAVELIIETTCGTHTITQPVQIRLPDIAGPGTAFPLQENITFSVPDFDASYSWFTGTGDTEISGGSNGTSVLANIGCGTDTIFVNITNLCYDTTLQKIISVEKPWMTGPAWVPHDTTAMRYQIKAFPNTTYTWTIPGTASITSGASTNSITTNWQAEGGFVKVALSNNCGISKDSMEVTIRPDWIINDFERTILAFHPFGGAAYAMTENPFPASDNNSSYSGFTCKTDFAQSWAGIYADPGYKFRFTPGDTLTMMVYGTKTGVIMLKLEDISGGATTPTISRNLTAINEWQKISFPVGNVPDNIFNRITLFFDLGSTAKDTFYFDNIYLMKSTLTGISNNYNSTSPGIKAFPVPAKEQLTLLFEGELSGVKKNVVLYNVMGKALWSRQLSGDELLVPLSTFTAGTYLLHVITDEGRQYRKKILIE